MRLKDKIILISGAAGFLGSKIVETVTVFLCYVAILFVNIM